MKQIPYECAHVVEYTSVHVYATKMPSSEWVLAVHNDP